jgi:hypothetical protein
MVTSTCVVFKTTTLKEHYIHGVKNIIQYLPNCILSPYFGFNKMPITIKEYQAKLTSLSCLALPIFAWVTGSNVCSSNWLFALLKQQIDKCCCCLFFNIPMKAIQYRFNSVLIFTLINMSNSYQNIEENLWYNILLNGCWNIHIDDKANAFSQQLVIKCLCSSASQDKPLFTVHSGFCCIYVFQYKKEAIWRKTFIVANFKMSVYI